MVKPHGADALCPLIVTDPARVAALQAEAAGLPRLTLTSAAAANAVMLAAGYFTPLAGFQSLDDAVAIARELHTADGLFWPVPVLNLTSTQVPFEPGQRIGLYDPNVEGEPLLAVQTITAIEHVPPAAMTEIINEVFGTDDPAHPGVATFRSQGDTLISGPIEVLNFSYFERDFPETFRTAMQIRDEITERGWERVVAFQTRNPMHRAHEELCKMAQRAVQADGILVHMLLGKLKPGDIPADVRDAAIRKMVEVYFPPNSVMVTGYGFDMLYAGPREALLHAVFRQNCGCTHFIVGRDHAGVGDYYGAFDAQHIFDRIPANTLGIEIFKADHTAYSKKRNEVVMMRDHPDHGPEDYVLLSGTKVREMLTRGEVLPGEFARPEVAEILMRHYQNQDQQS